MKQRILDEYLLYSKTRIRDIAKRVVEALVAWHMERDAERGFPYRYDLATLEEIKEYSGVNDEKLLLKALEYLRRRGVVAKHTARKKDGVNVRWRLSNTWYYRLVELKYKLIENPDYLGSLGEINTWEMLEKELSG